jgi:hypothetical protein
VFALICRKTETAQQISKIDIVDVKQKDLLPCGNGNLQHKQNQHYKFLQHNNLLPHENSINSHIIKYQYSDRNQSTHDHTYGVITYSQHLVKIWKLTHAYTHTHTHTHTQGYHMFTAS